MSQKKQKCHLYRINGIEDHIHIVTHLHPTIALANLVKEIKLATDDFIIKDFIIRPIQGLIYATYSFYSHSTPSESKYTKYKVVHKYYTLM